MKGHPIDEKWAICARCETDGAQSYDAASTKGATGMKEGAPHPRNPAMYNFY